MITHTDTNTVIRTKHKHETHNTHKNTQNTLTKKNTINTCTKNTMQTYKNTNRQLITHIPNDSHNLFDPVYKFWRKNEKCLKTESYFINLSYGHKRKIKHLNYRLVFRIIFNSNYECVLLVQATGVMIVL